MREQEGVLRPRVRDVGHRNAVCGRDRSPGQLSNRSRDEGGRNEWCAPPPRHLWGVRGSRCACRRGGCGRGRCLPPPVAPPPPASRHSARARASGGPGHARSALALAHAAARTYSRLVCVAIAFAASGASHVTTVRTDTHDGGWELDLQFECRGACLPADNAGSLDAFVFNWHTSGYAPTKSDWEGIFSGARKDVSRSDLVVLALQMMPTGYLGTGWAWGCRSACLRDGLPPCTFSCDVALLFDPRTHASTALTVGAHCARACADADAQAHAHAHTHTHARASLSTRPVLARSTMTAGREHAT